MKNGPLFWSITLAAFFLLCGCSKKENEIQHTKELLDRISRYQTENFSFLPDSAKGNHHDYGFNAWTNAVFYLGLAEWSANSPESTTYDNWLMEIGNSGNWQVAANFKDHPRYQRYHADELCIGQFYLTMYNKHKENKMISSTLERIDWIMNNPPDTGMHYRNKQSWTWCDALFMSPPVYVRLAAIKKNPDYIDYMHMQFLRSYKHLYDPQECLFFRDDSYFDKKEANGEKVFWGRGNGWVLAGLANILTYLPQESHIRPFYENLFKELAHRLKSLQNEDGFWHASLLDPESYPAPETSATALITYGLIYGINNKLLDKTYLPCAQKAWQSLCSVVDENGKIGWVQPIGADPKKVTKDMSAVYGTGAFLLAGNEMIKLINNQ